MGYGSGSPLGVVRPGQTGDEYYDFVNQQRWIAAGRDPSTWELSAADAAAAAGPKKGSVSLSNNVAHTLVVVPVPAGAMVTGTLEFSVFCSDGSAFQSFKGRVDWSAINPSGPTITTDQTPLDVVASVPSSGTLDVAVSLVQVGAQLAVKLTANSTLIPTILSTTFVSSADTVLGPPAGF